SNKTSRFVMVADSGDAVAGCFGYSTASGRVKSMRQGRNGTDDVEEPLASVVAGGAVTAGITAVTAALAVTLAAALAGASAFAENSASLAGSAGCGLVLRPSTRAAGFGGMTHSSHGEAGRGVPGA